MAILPDKWDEPRQREAPPSPPEVQAIQAMRDSGFGFDEISKLEFDGRLHRVRVAGDKGNERTGWYVFFGDGIPAGEFGNWRLNESKKWHANIARPFSPEEEFLLQEKYKKTQTLREAEAKRRHEIGAKAAMRIWERAPEATDDHPYLVKKGIKNHGLRITGDGRLILPIYEQPGVLSSLQYINANGDKQFQGKGDINGGMFLINCVPECSDNSVYFVEGYATGASVHEATGARVVVALNAGNLSKAVKKIAPSLAGSRVVIVADNDVSGVGQKAAEEAAMLINARCIIPPAPEGQSADANDFAQAGGDLKALLAPTEDENWLQSAEDFCKNPEPIRWLIKGHVMRHAMQMIFGDSGTGKTFYALSLLLAIASDSIDDWCGRNVRHGNVVYLAGEGHIGLKARVAGWAHKHGVDLKSLRMFFSKRAVDINASNVADYVIGEIEKMKVIPDVVAIDTLHRFLEGDENTAKDAKSFLTACTKVSVHFNNCTIILIHHTGQNADAKGRARGSSAWKGAMDLEVLVSKNPGDSCILITQTKSKDAELEPKMWLNQVEVVIPDWYDEDGNPIKTVVLEQGEPISTNEKEDVTLHRAFNNFMMASFEHGIIEAPDKYGGLHEDDWRDYFYKHYTGKGKGKDAKRVAYNRTRNLMLESGRAYVDEDSYYYPDGFICKTYEKDIMMHLKPKTKKSPEKQQDVLAG